MKLTTSQALIKFLNMQYIMADGKEQPLFKGIYTIFGHGNVLGIGQALEENRGDLEIYQGRNEQGMAHAAIAFAKQKLHRQLIACTSSVGPGSANMITAAATATANNIPLLLIPGDTFASRQPDPVLQQVEQPYDVSLSTNDAFRPVSKYWDRITRPEQLMSAMLNAMRVLTNQGETGAVTIALPQDVQAESYVYPSSFFKKRVHQIRRTVPIDDELQEAVRLMTQKQKPLIICGGGVRYSKAGEILKEFASRFQIPFAETQAGKSAISSDHPLNLGGIGVTGNQAANDIAKQADLIIGVGTRYTDFTTASKQLFQHEDVDFLTINLSDFHASKLDGQKLVGDAKITLEILSEKLHQQQYKTKYTNEISDAKLAWEQELSRLYQINYHEDHYEPEVNDELKHHLPEYVDSLNTTLTQTTVLGKINTLIDSTSIIVGAAGSLPGDLQRMWINREPETYHLEYGYSCMGYEISGALGVKMAEPDKEVYAMVGDGSYMMLHSELITSIQENRKINVLLFDNASFGCINNLQMGHGMGSIGTEFRMRNHDSNELNGRIHTVDFAKNASAYGVKTYTVRTLDELEDAFTDATSQSISTLIDIKVLPKTMTDGYDSWWHVGVADSSEKKSVQEAYMEKEKELSIARKY